MAKATRQPQNTVPVIALQRLYSVSQDCYIEKGETVYYSPEVAQQLITLGLVESTTVTSANETPMTEA